MDRISSVTREGIPELWEDIDTFRKTVLDSGQLEMKRERQHKVNHVSSFRIPGSDLCNLLVSQVWMWNHIKEAVMQLFKEHPAVKAKIPKLEHLVSKSAITSGYAADILLQEFQKSFQGVKEEDDDEEEQEK